jgi:hypothetical protein
MTRPDAVAVGPNSTLLAAPAATAARACTRLKREPHRVRSPRQGAAIGLLKSCDGSSPQSRNRRPGNEELLTCGDLDGGRPRSGARVVIQHCSG